MNRIAFVAALGLLTPISLATDRIFFEDFSSGSDQGWTHYTFAHTFGVWDASTEAYRLGSSQSTLGSTGSILDQSADASFVNGYWGARGRHGANSRCDLSMRITGNGYESYHFAWSAAAGGTLSISRLAADASVHSLTSVAGVAWPDNVDYMIEAGAIGDRIELRLWLAGTSRPETATLATTDSSYPQGLLSLVGRAGFQTVIDTTFDDVYFDRVIECLADFDGDGFVTGLDFDTYVSAFESGLLDADFDNDGFVTGLDFDAYVAAFESGCD